ncbi:MAG: DUF1552 domain-containing protein [Lentisphaeraceae bacterium]|nr:DUF1552 domain-containing protein [Lentisphaeraceae bacterium]
MALPWLETFAQSRSSSITRAAFLYMPNGVNPDTWTPVDKGFNYTPSEALKPLGKYKQQVSTFTNLQHKLTLKSDNPDPHRVGTANILSGAQAFHTRAKDMSCGTSLDQVMAQKWGKDTYLPSIELSVREPNSGVSNHGYTELYGSFISWLNDKTPVPREIYPRQAFDRLFTQRERKGLSKNAMDTFRVQTQRLQKKLGREDKPRLEEYLTTIDELEQRIRSSKSNMKPLPFDLDKNRPDEGRPRSFLQHFEMHLDIIALAFQSGRTRIGSLMLGNALSSYDYSPVIEDKAARASFHSISHHTGSPEKLAIYTKINQHHVKLFANFMAKLDSMPEADGSVLDNTLIFMGSSMRDGNKHRPIDLPILLGGGRKLLKLGEHKVLPEGTPLCNLFATILKASGFKNTQFGDSNAIFEDILI